MPPSQLERSLSATTPLGEDVLLLRRMTGSERLGAPFEYQLELVSENIEIDPADLLGQPIAVRLNLLDDDFRQFNGLVSRFSHTGFDGDVAVYQATLVPWLWFLTRTADCRIFQDQTAPEIIKVVFRELGFTDFEERLSGSYRQRGYCVQYRETDFNFVSRLMEQEGIYYYFLHADGKHTLVLADGYSAHETVDGYAEVPYYPPTEGTLRERDHIDAWSVAKAVQPGAYAHTDFDFTAPRKGLAAKRSDPKSHELAGLEVFDYPGVYTETSDGEGYARVRLEELHADYETAAAGGNARGLGCGALFSLTNYPREDQNREYLILGADYQLQSDPYLAGDTAPDTPVFMCQLTAMDAQVPFRPPRTARKPVVQGPQTAIVVGKSGEEIWTDEYGRVKVQFHWDRYGQADENSSCWVRVSQPWAGKQWGAIQLPRIGQEVIVDFLEGDPDRPIITGRVYNGSHRPPYGLPAEATKSTVKSNSSKGGGGFNEIRFEDKKGQEQVFIHAERNHDLRVKNDRFEWVGNEQHLIVQSDQLERVDGDQHLTVGGDSNTRVKGTVSLEADMDLQQKVGMKQALEAGMEIHLKAGMNLVLEAGMSITLKAGAAFVVVGPTGVIINGVPLLINSGGAPGVGSGCSPDRARLPGEADDAEPGIPFQAITNPQAMTLLAARKSGAPFCAKCEAARRARAAQ